LGRRIGGIEQGKQTDLMPSEADDYRAMPCHRGINLLNTVIERGRIVDATAPEYPTT